MNKEQLITLLEGYEKEHIEQYASYIQRLSTEKNKDGTLKNDWVLRISEEKLSDLFKRVAKDGLVFDGIHITLQKTGISYDYVAFKNKMLLAYPESTVDVSLVYKGDTFNVEKDSGVIKYAHSVSNPFDQKDEDIIGAYCIIKNKRGEFLTTLSKVDIEKHRKSAKTDYIWRMWLKEMSLKTIIKKACKQHFADVYEDIEKNDNENYSLENPLDIELQYKAEIDAVDTVEDLKAYYLKNKGRGKVFDKYVTIRKNQLTN